MDKIKNAFGSIQADDTLKQNTLAYIRQHRPGPSRFVPKLAAAVCVLAILLCGSWLYFTPTARLAIEIAPSIELQVNAFDRVISASGSNSAGRDLLTELDLLNLSYEEAVDRILSDATVSAILQEGEILSIGVIAPEGPQAQRMLSEAQTHSGNVGESLCYQASPETAESAHSTGLSCGKYRILLELQQLDPNITPEQVRNLTMKQLRSWLQALKEPEPPAQNEPPKDCPIPAPPATDPTAAPASDPSEPGNHNGNGHGNGQGDDNGQGNGHRHGNG